jgi:hypothetical protein
MRPTDQSSAKKWPTSALVFIASALATFFRCSNAFQLLYQSRSLGPAFGVPMFSTLPETDVKDSLHLSSTTHISPETTNITESPYALLNNDLWDAYYHELADFYNQHGHVYVPMEYSEGQEDRSQLAHFCHVCRGVFQKQLNQTRKRQLNDIGFSWSKRDAIWEMRFQQLEAYARQHGDCDVPLYYKSDRMFGNWVQKHRELLLEMKENATVQETNTLSPTQEMMIQRLKRLESIGLGTQPPVSNWRRYWEQLRDFWKEHGHHQVPTTDDYISLYHWTLRQRNICNEYNIQMKIKGDEQFVKVSGLDEERIQALKEISFWDEPSPDVTIRDEPIAAQSSQQINITESPFALLNNDVWDAYYHELVDFYNQHSHVYVPSEYSEDQEDHRQLANFCHVCRGVFKNVLNDTRVRQLKDIGFSWNKRDASWEKRFQQLETYARQHGNCDVPLYYKLDEMFGKWVQEHRELLLEMKENATVQETNTLSPTQEKKNLRLKRLESIGLGTQPPVSQWRRSWERLRDFWGEHGHHHVPSTDDYIALYQWTLRQRKLRNEYKIETEIKGGEQFVQVGGLDEERIQALKEIDFWDEPIHAVIRRDEPKAAQSSEKTDYTKFTLDLLNGTMAWDTYYQELVSFYNQHGHVHVPLDDEPSVGQDDYRQLAFFCLACCDHYQKWNNEQEPTNNILNDKRIQQLNNLDFDWNKSNSLWDMRFQQLKDYAMVHGDCNVPRDYESNRKLERWVREQRLLRQHTTQDASSKFSSIDANISLPEPELLIQRQKRLESIGFEWQFYASNWRDKWERLRDFWKEYGHHAVPYKNKDLFEWTARQRKFCQEYQKKMLSGKDEQFVKVSGFEEERIKALKEIAFWDEPTTLKQVRKMPLSTDLSLKSNKVKFALALRNSTIWDDHYQQLVRFYNQHGHVHVPVGEPSEDQNVDRQLAYFCLVCRDDYQKWKYRRKAYILNDTRIQQLENLGFDWSARNALWETRFQQLKRYAREHGDCNVPKNWISNPQLGNWVDALRSQHQRMIENANASVPEQKLSAPQALLKQQHKRLESIGFEWQPQTMYWRRNWERLRDFWKEQGHHQVPSTADYYSLYHWTLRQRNLCREYQKKMKSKGDDQLVKRGGLDDDKIKALKEISFWDEPVDNATIRRARKLTAASQTSPETNITKTPLALLNNEVWDIHYQELVHFYNQHGHVYVPLEDSIVQEEYRQLAHFCRICREYYRFSRLRTTNEDRSIILNNTRIQLLEDLGFDWSAINAQWEFRFQQLKDYAKEHGDCNVPRNWIPNPQLGSWIREQRGLHLQMIKNASDLENNITSADRELLMQRGRRLEAIGFEWNTRDMFWKRNWERLYYFYSKHGHHDVHWTDRQLYHWVLRQRSLCDEYQMQMKYLKDERLVKVKGLDDDRIKALKKIDFWEPRPATRVKPAYISTFGTSIPWKRKTQPNLQDNTVFETLYQELVNFYNQHGHVCVTIEPSISQDDYRELAAFCRLCRLNYRYYHNLRKRYKSCLTSKRIRQLEALGLDWNVENGNWNRRFQELIEYSKIHGNCNVQDNRVAYPELDKWATVQRAKKRRMDKSPSRSSLPRKVSVPHEEWEERVKKLDSIGFNWEPKLDHEWRRMWEQLRDYKKTHGNYEINSSTDPDLADWVETQRILCKNYKKKMKTVKAGTIRELFTISQVKALKEIGFWDQDW